MGLYHSGAGPFRLLYLAFVLPTEATDYYESTFNGLFHTPITGTLFSHAAFDRMLGLGLKYCDDFKHMHLGLTK